MAPFRNRKSKTRTEWAIEYARLEEERAKQRFTAPRDFWILRSYAAKLFKDIVCLFPFMCMTLTLERLFFSFVDWTAGP